MYIYICICIFSQNSYFRIAKTSIGHAIYNGV